MPQPRERIVVSDAEFRQALCLSAHDAIRNTPEPTADALWAMGLLMHRLSRPGPFSVKEEGEWLSHLMDAGWELTAPFDPEAWKALTDAP